MKKIPEGGILVSQTATDPTNIAVPDPEDGGHQTPPRPAHLRRSVGVMKQTAASGNSRSDES